MHSEGALPPERVVRAFGASGPPVPLPGGIAQTAWRVGDVVLKPVHDGNVGEGEWIAQALDAIVEDGFRVARPVAARDGRWVVDNWTAQRWLDGVAAHDAWETIIGASRAFHAALARAITRAGVAAQPRWLDTRAHRWAHAERTVWHGAPLPHTVNTGALEGSLFARAIALGPPLTESELAHVQVVHGDVASNVLALTDGGQALIDVSPGWRTCESVAAQIAVEAVTWFGGDDSLLDGFERADLARACAFRLLCGLQASADWAKDFPGELEAWTRTLTLLGA